MSFNLLQMIEKNHFLKANNVYYRWQLIRERENLSRENCLAEIQDKKMKANLEVSAFFMLEECVF